jgi:hypothetical protein
LALIVPSALNRQHGKSFRCRVIAATAQAIANAAGFNPGDSIQRSASAYMRSCEVYIA